MASRIQGITIEIGTDTTKLESALKSVNSVIKTDHGKYLLVVKKTESLVVCCSINSEQRFFILRERKE